MNMFPPLPDFQEVLQNKSVTCLGSVSFMETEGPGLRSFCTLFQCWNVLYGITADKTSFAFIKIHHLFDSQFSNKG